MTILGRLAAFGFALCVSWAACAQPASFSYPSKPIRIVCAFPVGGIADLYARIIGQRVAESWGQGLGSTGRLAVEGNLGRPKCENRM